MEYLGTTTVPQHSNNAVAATLETGSYANVTEAWVKAAKSTLNAVKPKAAPAATEAESHPLSTPAWVGGFLLGLIGLVEVIRLVVDVVT
jgi:hypothetical protein